MARDSLVSQELQVARPPEVLERSLPIQEEYVQLACRRFRLCGVNLDKNVRRHHMHSDRVTESLHYFYSYGVLNRIDFSALYYDVRIDNSSLGIYIQKVAEALGTISTVIDTFMQTMKFQIVVQLQSSYLRQ